MYAALADEVRHLCERMQQGLEHLAHERTEPEQELEGALRSLRNPVCEVGIVGLQGHGKSTLINALLERTLLYSSAAISTRRVIRLCYGDSRVEVETQGLVERYPLSYLSELGRGDTVVLDASSRITAYCPADCLLDGVCLVDTPGEDAGLGSGHDDALVADYLAGAKVVLVVCHALKPVLSAAFDLLERARQQATNVVVALTACDLLDDDELEEAVGAARRAIDERLGSSFALFPVSAMAALAGDHAGQAAIAALREHLRYLALDVERAAAHRALSTLTRLGAELRTQAEERLWRLEQDEVQARAALERISAVLAKHRAEAGRRKAEVSKRADATRELGALTQTHLHAAQAAVCSYVNAHDIVQVNAGLSDQAREELQRAASSAYAVVQAWLDEALEPLVLEAMDLGILIEPQRDLKKPSVPTLSIAKEAEGILAWMADPDDSKRRRSARLKAQSAMRQAWAPIVDALHKSAEKAVRASSRALCRAIDQWLAERAAQANLEREQYQLASAQRRATRAEIDKLADMLGQAASEEHRLHGLLEVLEGLEAEDCSSALERLETGALPSSGALAELSDALLQAWGANVGSPTATRCFWVHLAAAETLMRGGRLLHGLRQADLALSLAEGLGLDAQARVLRLEAAVLLQRRGPAASSAFLQQHSRDGTLLEERLAVSVLSGELGLARQLLLHPTPDGDGRTWEIVRYACRTAEPCGKRQSDGPLQLLGQYPLDPNGEEAAAELEGVLLTDASWERHLVARLLRFARLDEETQHLVDRAYGTLQPSEATLPLSLLRELEQTMLDAQPDTRLV